jgi:hypothetical protein
LDVYNTEGYLLRGKKAMKFFFFNLWQWFVSLTIQGKNTFGKVVITVNIHDLGTSFTVLHPSNINAQLLSAALSQQFVEEWQTVSNFSPVETARWQQMAEDMNKNGIQWPVLMAMREIEQSRNSTRDNRDVS